MDDKSPSVNVCAGLRETIKTRRFTSFSRHETKKSPNTPSSLLSYCKIGKHWRVHDRNTSKSMVLLIVSGFPLHRTTSGSP